MERSEHLNKRILDCLEFATAANWESDKALRILSTSADQLFESYCNRYRGPNESIHSLWGMKILKLAAGIANAEWDKQKHDVERKIAAEHMAEALQYSRFILEV